MNCLTRMALIWQFVGVMGNGQILSGLRALVVDDDDASAKLVAVVLRGEGCEVEVARNAEDALATLTRFRPDFIVLDLVLPLMSGLSFASHLKADAATSAMAIFVLTVVNGLAAEQAALAAGCTAYFRKPIEPLSFPERIVAYLKGTP